MDALTTFKEFECFRPILRILIFESAIELEVSLGVYSHRDLASPCLITHLEGLPSIHLLCNEPQMT
jgi:hypothetical protein